MRSGSFASEKLIVLEIEFLNSFMIHIVHGLVSYDLRTNERVKD